MRALLWNSGTQQAGAAVELIAARSGEARPAIESKDLAAGALQTWTLRAEVPAGGTADCRVFPASAARQQPA